MNNVEQQHFNVLYQQHLINLRLQGMRPSTIDAYARAVRRITDFFDKTPDTLITQDLKNYFHALIQTHSWSTIKLDRNGLQFFYRHPLNKQWESLRIVKPPQVKRLPDILSSLEVAQLISHTQKQRYQVFFLTLYSMGLRLSEGLNLTIFDIDATLMQVHIRDGKGGKDRLVPLPHRTLQALRAHWKIHQHQRLIFPGFGINKDAVMDKGGVQKAIKQVMRDCGSIKTLALTHFAIVSRLTCLSKDSICVHFNHCSVMPASTRRLNIRI